MPRGPFDPIDERVGGPTQPGFSDFLLGHTPLTSPATGLVPENTVRGFRTHNPGFVEPLFFGPGYNPNRTGGPPLEVPGLPVLPGPPTGGGPSRGGGTTEQAGTKAPQPTFDFSMKGVPLGSGLRGGGGFNLGQILGGGQALAPPRQDMSGLLLMLQRLLSRR